MADKTLPQLPIIVLPSTGSITYLIEGSQSYQGTFDVIFQKMINEYGIFANQLNSSVMNTGNAQVILDGLNNATTAKLSSDRIDLDLTNFVSGYFDIDGGTFYDTYANASTFDGGTF